MLLNSLVFISENLLLYERFLIKFSLNRRTTRLSIVSRTRDMKSFSGNVSADLREISKFCISRINGLQQNVSYL